MIKLIDKIKNNMSTDIELSKVQINKIIKEGGNLGKLLMSFLPKLIKSDISLGKQFLAPLGSGNTTLIISNDNMDDLIKIVTALEEHDILLKGISKTIRNETKEQKGGFLSMLLGTLGASLLSNLLSGKGLYRTGQGMYRTRLWIKKN